MRRPRGARRIGAVLAAASLVLGVHASSARAGALQRTGEFAGSFGEATFDILVLRPTSVAALALGSVFFVASVPLVTPGPAIAGHGLEGLRTSWSTFVYAPYEYTIVRDIGDF